MIFDYANNVPYSTQPKIVERHFLDLLQRYGDVVAVDLTDKVRNSFLLFFIFSQYLSVAFPWTVWKAFTLVSESEKIA